MSDATKEFCRNSGPFEAVYRPQTIPHWVVRDCRGADVALCEEEDAATAIAEALNGQRA